MAKHESERRGKIGDTPADIEEGRNAGMWTIAVVECGNEIGLSKTELASLPSDERRARIQVAEKRLSQAGAHFVVPRIADTIPVVQEIDRRVQQGEHP
jgi:phosphonoacetaldehyde hydrolase